jgi:nicotinate-nucleotide adenylyltransferase
MPIGLFGGTFDPPHVGHLILAERCREEAGLDAVWFLPSFRPPHKPDGSVTSFEVRVEMVRAGITGATGFEVTSIEAELPPPSYTARTLAALHARHPGTDFRLILGGDSVVDLPNWFEPKRVLAQAGLIVVPRPGVQAWSAVRLAAAVGVPPAAVRMQTVDCPLIDVASRDIRKRVATGKGIRFLVPREVEAIVRNHRLYVDPSACGSAAAPLP